MLRAESQFNTKKVLWGLFIDIYKAFGKTYRNRPREVAMEYAQFSKKSKIAKELYHCHSIGYWAELDGVYAPNGREDFVLVQ